jgi:hypothetical protein
MYRILASSGSQIGIFLELLDRLSLVIVFRY